MDDAFTLLRRAVELLPEDAVAENGQSVRNVRAEIAFQEWEMALDVLIELADVHPVSTAFWAMLVEAAVGASGGPGKSGTAPFARRRLCWAPGHILRGRAAQATVGHR
ncbi:hypothetical protein [Kitasatospora cheerisanensis]|uniref:Uncharacterized protein n=1 Tax=Kitasatospora cheerisanensis KCTC 2395 TaxID=1348663 RepID=A0A066Z2L8_9ACTN|nr:hypothetical protein [Kitasatospora cheerisanensis]KDN87702.1 hypothetical protein KCH_05370 [Kitasatospora cheerisanensis KCTC 2395]